MYRNVPKFYILILYIATLFGLFILTGFFFLMAEFLRFSLYNIIFSANRDTLTSSFMIRRPFISIAYIIALAWTSSAMLNRSAESGCLYLALIKKKSFQHLPLNMMLAVGLSYMPFIIVEVLSLHTQIL